MSDTINEETYKLFVRDHIINNLNKTAYLWDDVPLNILQKIKLVQCHDKYRVIKDEDKEDYIEDDIGIDIIQVDQDEITIIKCKKDNEEFDGLGGIYFLLCNYDHLKYEVYCNKNTKIFQYLTDFNRNPSLQYIVLPIKE